jgi:hypothetical protein
VLAGLTVHDGAPCRTSTSLLFDATGTDRSRGWGCVAEQRRDVLDIVLTDAGEVVPAPRLRFFVLPLGLDLLSVSTALGVLGLTGWARWRVSLVLASCQISAMLAGLVLSVELAEAIGESADYVGAGAFIVLGIYLSWIGTPVRSSSACRV